MEIAKELLEAAGKPKEEISPLNLFREIGFDKEMSRLGWVNPPSWGEVENSLRRVSRILRDKEVFIFVGIGGSINGIKSLLPLKKNYSIYTLNSLDPLALKNIWKRIKEPRKVLVIPISKSGTTLETLVLARTIKNFLPSKVERNFLWISDPASYSRLDASGFDKDFKTTIQLDGNSDIGGRFSCPHTLIFLLPLFLILKKDLRTLKKIFLSYLALKEEIIKESIFLASEVKDIEKGYFCIRVKKIYQDGLTPWITQLFQESLGSKKRGFYVKTIVTDKKITIEDFFTIGPQLRVASPFVYIMSLMYFLQNFVAYFAYFKKINFVNQPCVERYKREIRLLSDKRVYSPPSINFRVLKKEIEKKLNSKIKFLECVLYFYPSREFIQRLENFLRRNFPQRISLVFLGSDWNHHSYQAAYRDRSTLYVILTREDYDCKFSSSKKEVLERNVLILRKIAYATHRTLKDKSLFFSI